VDIWRLWDARTAEEDILTNTKTLTDYDSYAGHFDRQRQPGAAVIRFLQESLPLTGTCLSIGCGTGQYEAALGSERLVGLDRSRGMLKLASDRIRRLLHGDMLHLPIRGESVAGAYLVNALHHLGGNLEIDDDERESSRLAALSQVQRALKHEGRIAIVQRDPEQNRMVWFWKYFPKALATKLRIQPRITSIQGWLSDCGFTEISATPLHDEMIKGFFTEDAPMREEFRYSFSEFSYLTAEELQDGLSQLRVAIHDGTARADIELCKKRFSQIGGTTFGIRAVKP